MEKRVDISFIIVNYRSEKIIRKCISSIIKSVSIPFEIIVVNNDNSSLDFSQLKNPVKIISSRRNIGFGPAVNLGALEAKGSILGIINPDIIFLSKKINTIPKRFSEDKNIGIIGPKLLNEDGSEQQWSAGVSPGITDLIKNNLGVIRSRRIWKSREETEADWISGASLFIKKVLFERLSGFDDNYFMYYEDVDLCTRAKKSGYKILYFPQIEVSHLGGKSFRKKSDQKKYFYDSQKYYFKKHHGKTKAKIVDILRKLTH